MDQVVVVVVLQVVLFDVVLPMVPTKEEEMVMFQAMGQMKR